MKKIGRQGMTPLHMPTYLLINAMDLPLEAIVVHVDRETTRIYTHLRADDLLDAVQNLESTSLTVCNKSAASHNEPKARSSKKVSKMK